MTLDDDKPLTPQQARQKLQKGLREYLAGNNPGPIVFTPQADQEGRRDVPAQAHPAAAGNIAPMHTPEPGPEEEDRASRGRHADRWRHLERTAQAQR